MGGQKILVVDDEQLIGIALTQELGEEGYQVEYVLSGEDAIEKVKIQFYDLIFVDLVMPGINGVATCQRIKSLSPQTEIVCFTGTYDKQLIARQMEFIAAGGRLYFLYKPFKEGYILKAVQKVLAKSS